MEFEEYHMLEKGIRCMLGGIIYFNSPFKIEIPNIFQN